jgi:hypothetical protein
VLGIVLIQYFEYPWRAAKPNANLQGEGFKEELPMATKKKAAKKKAAKKKKH